VGEPRETPKSQPEAESVANRGRLLAKPTSPLSDVKVRSGLRPLGLALDETASSTSRQATMRARRCAGTDVARCGATPVAGISHFLDLADEVGVVLLAPESRGRTWDVLVGGYGPDVEFIDLALDRVFDRLALDTRRLAITGFLRWGLLRPLARPDQRGPVHARDRLLAGVHDPAHSAGANLPLRLPRHARRRAPDRALQSQDRSATRSRGLRCSLPGVRRPHTVPYSVAREALDWFTSG
jgi:hypothetical protein